MRGRASVAFLAMTLTAFAGCSGGEAVSARTNLAIADDTAHAWDSGATLVEVNDVEFRNATEVANQAEQSIREQGAKSGASDQDIQDGIDAVHAFLAADDDNPGDGKAPAWAYLYVSPHGARGIVVDASGSVTYNKDVPHAGNAGPSVGSANLASSWKIDSDEAASIAARGDSAYGNLVGKPDTYAFSDLDFFGEAPVWRLFVGSTNPSGMSSLQAMVVVNAQNGTIVNQTPTPTPTPTPGPQPTTPFMEDGQSRGTLDPILFSADSADFNVQSEGHMRLHLVLSADNAFGPVTVTAHVTSPDGSSRDVTVSSGLAVGDSPSSDATILDPAAGAWQVGVTLNQGARQQYTFSWCTDGLPTGESTGTNPAC